MTVQRIGNPRRRALIGTALGALALAGLPCGVRAQADGLKIGIIVGLGR